MKVAIDTNIFVQDFWFEGLSSKVFFDELKIVPATLHIPEIVVDETVNKYREQLISKIETQKKINKDITKLLKDRINGISVDVEKRVNKYKKYLLKKLENIKTEVLPYPTISHKDVVEKILKRNKPFRKGDSGYRDFLIWQTIRNLEVWGIEEIVFITNNKADFGESGFLSEEFVDKRTSSKNFKVINSLSDFNEEYIIPKLKKLEKLETKLIENQIIKFNLRQWLTNQFIEKVEESKELFKMVFTGIPYEAGRTSNIDILSFDNFKIQDVRELGSGEKIVLIKVTCKVAIHLDIDRYDYENYY